MFRIAVNLNPVNPVALREMRSMMRGPRTFILLGSYLCLLAFLLYAVYLKSGGGTTYNYGGSNSSSNFGPTRSFEIGQNLFITVFLFLLGFVSLVSPVIMGGVVSRELENKTYELLVITPLRNRSVAFGKLFAGLGFIFFMVFSALPMACIVFIFGGVTPENLITGYAVILLATITYSIVGLFFSALIKRTGLAIMFTYGVIALSIFGSSVLSNSIVAGIMSEQSKLPSGTQKTDPRIDPSFDFSKRMLVVSPLAAVGSVLARNAPYHSGGSDELQLFPNSRLFGGMPSTYYSSSYGNSQINELARKPVLPGDLPLYIGFFLIYTAASLLFFLLSLLLVKPGAGARLPSFGSRLFQIRMLVIKVSRLPWIRPSKNFAAKLPEQPEGTADTKTDQPPPKETSETVTMG